MKTNIETSSRFYPKSESFATRFESIEERTAKETGEIYEQATFKIAGRPKPLVLNLKQGRLNTLKPNLKVGEFVTVEIHHNVGVKNVERPELATWYFDRKKKKDLQHEVSHTSLEQVFHCSEESYNESKNDLRREDLLVKAVDDISNSVDNATRETKTNTWSTLLNSLR